MFNLFFRPYVPGFRVGWIASRVDIDTTACLGARLLRSAARFPTQHRNSIRRGANTDSAEHQRRPAGCWQLGLTTPLPGFRVIRRTMSLASMLAPV